jgi:hypothetical protein
MIGIDDVGGGHASTGRKGPSFFQSEPPSRRVTERFPGLGEFRSDVSLLVGAN